MGIKVGFGISRNLRKRCFWKIYRSVPHPSIRLSSLSAVVEKANRIPIRILSMLTAHQNHLIHQEYLQPLRTATLSIELDANKSPLALLAQTCSQIGKPDPPSSSSSKLSSASSGRTRSSSRPSSGTAGDKEARGRSSMSGSNPGERRSSQEDKCSFKPYNDDKVGGESGRDGAGSNLNSGGSTSDKTGGFGVPSNTSSTNGDTPNFRHSFPTRTTSPKPGADGGSPPRLTQHPSQPYRRSRLPSGRRNSLSTSPSGDNDRHGRASPDSPVSVGSSNGRHLKKDTDVNNGAGADGPQLANSSQVRASANSSNASSECGGSDHEGDAKGDSPRPAQPNLGSTGHVAPVSPYKTSPSMFLPASTGVNGYHGSMAGAYVGYPLHQGTDSTNTGPGGVSGKPPPTSPPTASTPPSFIQSFCRDPYCLTYPCAPHLNDPSSSSLKSGFPLVYPSIHPSSSTFSHPLYTYGFMLPSEPPRHAGNWPCDKRFAASDELLSHLHAPTAPRGMDGKFLSVCPSAVPTSGPGCHLHLSHHQSGPSASLPGSLALRGPPPPGLGLARYHPYYNNMQLSLGPPGSIPLLHQASYYPHYALYSQRLGSASALGYQ